MRRLLLLICAAVTLFAAMPATTRHAVAAYPGATGRIAYISYESGYSDVWTVSPTNPADRVDLTNDAATDLYPEWSPDGTQIAFMTTRHTPGPAGDIYIMNADGTNQRRLTPDSREMFGLSWSPDGMRIAVAQLVPGSTNQDILVLNTDGSGETNITNYPGRDSSPSWSPDGTQIAFESDRLGATEIYLMGPNGESPHRLTNGGSAVKPDWSPDGSKIAFGAATGISVVNNDGSGLVTFASAFHAAAWSPDGSQLAMGDSTGLLIDTPAGAYVARAVPVPVGPDISWQPEFCRVATVVSGDTFTCDGGRTVRMLQIDAPDLGTCGGDWAKAALQFIFLTPGRVVALNYDAITKDSLGNDLAAPIWRGNDGADYNLSIIMAYVGLAKAAVVGEIKTPEVGGKKDVPQPKPVNNRYLQWARDSEGYARIAQWNMWAAGQPFNGGC